MLQAKSTDFAQKGCSFPLRGREGLRIAIRGERKPKYDTRSCVSNVLRGSKLRNSNHPLRQDWVPTLNLLIL